MFPISISYARLPFVWKNPLGYFAAISLQYIMGYHFFTFLGNVSFLGIGAFLFTVAAVKDLKFALKPIGKRGVLARNQEWTLSQLSGFMQFQAQVKQLSEFGIFHVNKWQTIERNRQLFPLFVGSSMNLWTCINHYLCFALHGALVTKLVGWKFWVVWMCSFQAICDLKALFFPFKKVDFPFFPFNRNFP